MTFKLQSGGAFASVHRVVDRYRAQLFLSSPCVSMGDPALGLTPEDAVDNCVSGLGGTQQCILAAHGVEIYDTASGQWRRGS